MDHPDKALEKSFLETIANSDLQDVGKTTAEVVIDSVLKEGLLRDIPLLSLVIGLAKAGVSVKEHMFIEKVLRFLSPLRKYTNEERRNYLASLDENELRNASQYMLLYLDRLDSLEKPPMLARVFEAFMLQQIRYKTMLYFSHFIDSVFILVWQDYHRVIKTWHDAPGGAPRIAKDDALALEKVGFYMEEHKAENMVVGDRFETALKAVKRNLVLTDAGWQFIQVVFQLWTSDTDGRSRRWLSVELRPGRY